MRGLILGNFKGEELPLVLRSTNCLINRVNECFVSCSFRISWRFDALWWILKTVRKTTVSFSKEKSPPRGSVSSVCKF